MTTCQISGNVIAEDEEVRTFVVNGKTITVSEDYNQCGRCDSVQLWDTEMYWQDTVGDGDYHEHMKGYDAVCDDCFYTLKEQGENND